MLSLLATIVTTASAAMADAPFRRGSDMLNIGGKTVSQRAVVNVLGRWQSQSDWNSIGRKATLDEFRSGDYYDDDLQKLDTDFNQPMEYYIARRPQFLNFCERYGLVARWVHKENVAKLPFTDAALAKSIGVSVAELNAEPVDEEAAEVVFDALCGSMAGFVDEEQCDAKRQTFIDEDGGFDEEGFRRALGETRRNNIAVLALGPGLGVGVLGLVGYKWLPTLLESATDAQAKMSAVYATDGPASLLLPMAVIGGFAANFVYEAQSGRRGGAASTARPALTYKERDILKQDELFLDKMKRKKRGELLDEEEAPKISGGSTQTYLKKMWATKGGLVKDEADLQQSDESSS